MKIKVPPNPILIHWKDEELNKFGQIIDKPPLGVMPKWLYEEQRIIDLTRAIHDYVIAGKLSANITHIEQWATELNERIKNYRGR